MRRILLPVLLALALPAASQTNNPSPAQPPKHSAHAEPADIRILRDLPYVSHGDPLQKLDLYLPKTPGEQRPLVVFIHGGAWRAGSKDNNPAAFLIRSGYVSASLGYRLTPNAIFPAQIEDCKSAIRWLRAHASEYGIDPQHIGVWGSSAGGHLVAMLGVTGQTRDFDVGENLDQSIAVQCVVDWYSPTDLLSHKSVIEPKYGNSSLDQFLGGPLAEHREAARKASPVYYVTKNSAPFLIMQGEKDPLVEPAQSRLMDAALRQAGVESTLEIIPGAKHGGPEFMTPERRKTITEFFNRHLKGSS